MSGDEPSYEKPKPPLRARPIHDLRRVVTSRHKMLAGTKPVEEAVALIQDTYGSDDDSSLAFVEWLRGGTGAAPPEKNTTVERIHVVTDPETGREERRETEPGSIPPRPR